MNDAVGVDIKGDLDLRNSARRRWQTREFEHAQFLVISSHFALTLVCLNLHGRLIVIRRCEDLAALGWVCRVALNQTSHNATLCFDAKGKRCDIEKENILDFTLQNSGLKRCSNSDNFVRVYALIWF